MKCLAFTGDYYHSSDGISALLAALETGYDWEFHGSHETVPWDRLPEYRLLVIAAENRLEPGVSDRTWLDDRTDRLIERFVTEGGGLFAFHSGIASYDENSAYRKLTGGSFQFHPKEHPRFEIVPTGTTHPLLRGVSRFFAVDEQYFVSRDPDTTLLAVAESSRYGSSAALWCAERGAGRTAVFTTGHRAETLELEGVRRIVRNAVTWCPAAAE